MPKLKVDIPTEKAKKMLNTKQASKNESSKISRKNREIPILNIVYRVNNITIELSTALISIIGLFASNKKGRYNVTIMALGKTFNRPIGV